MTDNAVTQNNIPTDGQPGEDQERGLGKALLIGAGAAAAGVTAYIAYKKATKKKKKKVKTKKGKTREIDCDVLVDESGNELPGQEFDESGRCINEDEVISKVTKQDNQKQTSATPASSESAGYMQGIDSKPTSAASSTTQANANTGNQGGNSGGQPSYLAGIDATQTQ